MIRGGVAGEIRGGGTGGGAAAPAGEGPRRAVAAWWPPVAGLDSVAPIDPCPYHSFNLLYRFHVREHRTIPLIVGIWAESRHQIRLPGPKCCPIWPYRLGTNFKCTGQGKLFNLYEKVKTAPLTHTKTTKRMK
jgi:hypothetical protein